MSTDIEVVHGEVIDAPPSSGTLLGIPINRIVAFAGPHISWLAGLIATWLVTKVDVLGIDGLNQANTATWVASAITFVLVSSLTWLGHQQWLKGHHIELRAASIAAANATSVDNTPVLPPPSGDYNPNEFAGEPDAGTDEDKQDDEELGRNMPLGWDKT